MHPLCAGSRARYPKSQTIIPVKNLHRPEQNQGRAELRGRASLVMKSVLPDNKEESNSTNTELSYDV